MIETKLDNHNHNELGREKHEEAKKLKEKALPDLKSTSASPSTTLHNHTEKLEGMTRHRYLPNKTQRKKNRIVLNQIASRNLKVHMTLSRPPEHENDLEFSGGCRLLRRRGETWYHSSDSESSQVTNVIEKKQHSNHSQHESSQLSTTGSVGCVYSLNLNHKMNLLIDD